MAGPDGKLLPGPWKSVGQRQRTHKVEQRPDGIYVQVPEGGGRGLGGRRAGSWREGLRQESAAAARPAQAVPSTPAAPAGSLQCCCTDLSWTLKAQPSFPHPLSQLNLQGSLASDEYAHKHECGLRIQTGHLRLRQAPAPALPASAHLPRLPAALPPGMPCRCGPAPAGVIQSSLISGQQAAHACGNLLVLSIPGVQPAASARGKWGRGEPAAARWLPPGRAHGLAPQLAAGVTTLLGCVMLLLLPLLLPLPLPLPPLPLPLPLSACQAGCVGRLSILPVHVRFLII